MVELIVNNQSLELRKDGSGIKYTMQIADVYNIAGVTSSYTNSFTIPKTPKNTRIFEQLGLVGDTSTLPYEKVPARLQSNGFPIIVSGWLEVKETSEDYKLNIINGMIDFFKTIENKTLGKDLDLSIFDHEKNVSTVVASFNNPNYKYLLGDYNGKNFGTLPDETTGINVDYLVPCFSVQKLLDIIFDTFGFTYESEALTSFMNGFYITYPKPPQEEAEPELIAEMVKGNFVTWQYQTDEFGNRYPAAQEFWASNTITEGELVNNWQFVIPESGSYQFEITTEAYLQQIFGFNIPAIMRLYVNGNEIAAIPTDPFAPVTLTHIYPAYAGDTVQIRLTSSGQAEFHHNSTNFKISKVDLGDVTLTNAFEDFAIKDFIKEILWRTALTPVINPHTNKITFIELSERLDFNNAIDWSNKFIKRNKETYDPTGLAQKNIFRLKHNNEDDTKGDGYLYVNNRNLPDQKILVNSKIYAPEPKGVKLINVGEGAEQEVDIYRVWNRESKANAAGEIEIDYKGLSNRFHFVRERVVSAPPGVDLAVLVSEYLVDSATVTSAPLAISERTLFDELVFKNWKEYEGVLFNFRKHDIELALTERDILELDMTVPYFFKQEGQYYMLNRLSYEEGKTTVGEFIRINKL